MIQIIPRVNHAGLYGSSALYYPVNAGLGATALSQTFGIDSAKHPVSVAGTFRHLVIGSNVPHNAFTVTLLVNGAATALTATCAADVSRASDSGAAVSVAAGDDVVYRIQGPQELYPGLTHHSTCIEFEAAACSYGITPGGAIAAGAAVFGGAFGNGEWSNFGGQPQSNHYSICAAAGTITRLDLKAYSGAPGASAWVGRIRTNGVTQDGTGGTVNTTCTLTGAATTAVSTFSLAVGVADLVDIVLARTGSDAAFALAHVAASVAFVPTAAGAYLLCGGSNDAIRSTGPDWKWTRNAQLVVTEPEGEAPIGPAGLHARGLYVRRPGAPGLGSGTVYTLRRSGADTPITLTIQDLATTGQITGTAAFAAGEAITVQATPFNAPGNNFFYWGLALAAAPPSASYTVDTRTIRRLRRAPHVSNEHQRVVVRRFELDLERGQALASGPGSDPYVLLRISRDGGQTWGEAIRMAAGHLGDYTARVQARRLGHARDTVFEVVVSDPIAWALVGAWLELDPGTN